MYGHADSLSCPPHRSLLPQAVCVWTATALRWGWPWRWRPACLGQVLWTQTAAPRCLSIVRIRKHVTCTAMTVGPSTCSLLIPAAAADATCEPNDCMSNRIHILCTLHTLVHEGQASWQYPLIRATSLLPSQTPYIGVIPVLDGWSPDKFGGEGCEMGQATLSTAAPVHCA